MDEPLVQIEEPKEVTMDVLVDNLKKQEEQTSYDRAKKAFDLAAAAVQKQMDDLAAKGKIFVLLPEEIDLLNNFRRFKKKITKNEVFRWQTLPVDLTSGLEGSVYGFVALEKDK